MSQLNNYTKHLVLNVQCTTSFCINITYTA